MLITQRLLAEGFDVVRLNLRDHGPGFHADPHALNRGLFLGTLLHESMEAVRRVADLAADRPVYLFGPSMGGNFVLRMAIAHRTAPIRNLRQVVAINPSINPGRAVDALDRDFMFRRYFRARWLASLWAKQRLFPDLYDFSGVEQHDTVRGMTEWLVKRYGLFATADEYFASYRVKGDDLVGVTAPTAIITAADDPVIPVADFYALAPDPNLLVQIHPTGGHCGYVDLAPFGHRLPDLILDVMCS
jgi:predicted alpha/beta-fold hydrolase